jgi:hypothetical protein
MSYEKRPQDLLDQARDTDLPCARPTACKADPECGVCPICDDNGVARIAAYYRAKGD